MKLSFYIFIFFTITFISCHRSDISSEDDQVLADTTLSLSFISQDISRNYQIHFPPSYNEETEFPLLVALHGGQSNGAAMMDNFYFDEIGDNEGFITVFPDSYAGQWADGRGTTTAEADGIDDVAFLSNLMDELISTYQVDACKLYLTGISSGGMMTQRVACDDTGRFTAYASIASSLPDSYVPHCQPQFTTSMAMVNGTEDQFSPYEGGPSNAPGSTGTVLGVAGTIAFWTTHNQCSEASNPSITNYPNIYAEDNSYVIRYDYGGCSQNNEVVLYEVVGGGHTFPGGPGPNYVPLVGYSNKDINGAEEIWNFFKEKTSCPN